MFRSLSSLLTTSSSSRKRSTSFRPTVTALEARTLMAAGVLDTSFSADGKNQVFFDAGGQNEDHATALAVQADGKIVIVGYVQGPNGDYDFGIARFHADGSRDDTFNPNGTDGPGRMRVPFDLGGGKNDRAHAVTIQNDGKIVVVGQIERNNGDHDMGVLRLNPDGSLDTAGFGAGNGKTFVAFDLGGSKVDSAFGVTMNGDKIVLAGYAQVGPINYDMAVAQLESDGSLDNDFGPGANGKTTVAFDLGGLLLDQANAVAMQGNKIIVAGTAHTNGNGVDMAVARLNGVNGSLDLTFSPGGTEGSGKAILGYDLGGNNYDAANALAIQTDGKIVLAGTVERMTQGDYDFAVVRLAADGAPDLGFGGGDGKQQVFFDVPNSSKDDRAYGVAIQSDGKILVAGTVATAVAGNTDFGIVRLTSVGNLDTSFGDTGRTRVAFDLGASNADAVAGVGLQSGDRVVVAGSVQRSMAGDMDFGVARLLGDPPAAPTVSNPGTAVVVDQGTFTLQGTAEAGSLVQVYRDVNNNNQIDPGDTVVGQQQLGVAETAFAINVPLIQSTANDFLVTATKLNSESAPGNAPTITDVFVPAPALPIQTPEGIVAGVTRRRRKSFVVVRGAQTGLLRRVYGPFSKVRIAMQDFNQDGVLDLVMQTQKNGKKQVQICSGVDLSVLHSARK